jgi:hypothetical protein
MEIAKGEGYSPTPLLHYHTTLLPDYPTALPRYPPTLLRR